MNEANSLIESMNSWGFAVNARIAFNKLSRLLKKKTGVTDEVQKIFNIIDDIVLGKEKEQFIVELTKIVGTIALELACRRRWRFKQRDWKDHGRKFQGYNEVNSREPLLGISGEGRNNISGASYLYLASNPETSMHGKLHRNLEICFHWQHLN